MMCKGQKRTAVPSFVASSLAIACVRHFSIKTDAIVLARIWLTHICRFMQDTRNVGLYPVTFGHVAHCSLLNENIHFKKLSLSILPRKEQDSCKCFQYNYRHSCTVRLQCMVHLVEKNGRSEIENEGALLVCFLASNVFEYFCTGVMSRQASRHFHAFNFVIALVRVYYSSFCYFLIKKRKHHGTFRILLLEKH